jgi:hypothetical protein
MAVKLLHALCLLLLAPGLMLAQADPQKPDSSPNNSELATEVKALREALLQTQKQMAAQQREIEALKERAKTEQVAAAGDEPSPRVIDAAMHTAIPSSLWSTGPIGANAVKQPVAQQEGNEKPLGSFNIGDAIFTPGGFVDFENIFRTTNTQNNIATNFAAIPYGNTAQGHLTEDRVTAQYSRFNIKVT